MVFVTLVVRFLKGNFTVDGWPSVEEGGQRRASPNAVLIGRGKFLYDEGRVHCASCNGEALNVQRYSPGTDTGCILGTPPVFL